MSMHTVRSCTSLCAATMVLAYASATFGQVTNNTMLLPGRPSPAQALPAPCCCDPRVPVSPSTTPGDADSLFRISAPGSYYLIANINGVSGKNGIEIATSGVTLDLMGFTLTGEPGLTSLHGIIATLGSPDIRGIAIRNGTLRGWGGDGIQVFSGAGNGGTLIEDVRVVNNKGMGIRAGFAAVLTRCVALGNLENGMGTGPGGLIAYCVANENTGRGFWCSTAASAQSPQGSTITNCTARHNTLHGIQAGPYSTILGCSTAYNQGHGIVSEPAAEMPFNESMQVRGCTASFNGMNGIQPGVASSVSDCVASFNAGNGIDLTEDASVTNCSCESNGGDGSGAGIRVTGERNRIEENVLVGNDIGIKVEGVANLIIRNSARGNTTNFDIAPGNRDAEVISPGSAFMNANPWANIVY